jgi:hypothetical protein
MKYPESYDITYQQNDREENFGNTLQSALEIKS